LNEEQERKAAERKAFAAGVHDGFPICTGYFAVAFSLGIAARNAGLSPFQGFLASLLNNASAGEYAGFTVIAAAGTYLEIAIVTLIANARYLLMSCALSQKFSPDTPFYHRLIIGWDITDELFGLAIARSGYLNPIYMYGAMLISLPGWSLGTALGIIVGNLLPVRIVSALSVALYGMFLAVIMPPAKRSRAIAVIIVVSFVLSYLGGLLPLVSELSSGMRIILWTVLIAGAAAVVKPVEEEEHA